jgi:dolichyl-phosphate-mannose--protein O-mannosyl transferase
MLSSEQKNLGTGSGQQIVTAIMDPTTTNTLWWVRGPNDPSSRGNEVSACSSETSIGEPILCNSIIRLTHLETMRNLHSHNVKSPLSRQQEVVSSHSLSVFCLECEESLEGQSIGISNLNC